MTNLSLRIATVITFLIALSACHSPVVPPEDLSSVDTYFPLIVPDDKASFVAALDRSEDEALATAYQDAIDVSMQAGYRIREAASAEEALATAARARELVRSNDFHFLTDQSVAINLLNRLLSEELTPEIVAALDEHTMVLVQNRHPDADLIQRALSRLEGSLSESERAERLAAATQSAQEWLRTRCPDCSSLDVGDAELRRQMNDQELAFVMRNEAALR